MKAKLSRFEGENSLNTHFFFILCFFIFFVWLLKIRYAYYFTHTISCPKQFSEGKSAGCKQSYQGLKAKIRDIIAYFHVSREDLTWWWRHVTWQWRQCSPLSRRGDRTTFWRELQSEIPYCASLMLIYRGLSKRWVWVNGDINKQWVEGC